MYEKASIFEMKEYGKICIVIKSEMEKSKITRNKLAKLTGARYDVINRYYNNSIERMDLDVLARICFVLGCEISDILKYEKP